MPDHEPSKQGPPGTARGEFPTEPGSRAVGGSSLEPSDRIEATVRESVDLPRTEGNDAGPQASTGPTTAGEASPSGSSRGIPTVLGYEILGEVGRGGMGVVYHARQILLNRPCALKMILAGEHADAVTSLRFLAEAEAVARLRHPNVVQIHHIGQAGGLPYLELEFVEGGSLDKALDGTPWTAKRAASLVKQLARGVGEAHRLGIVHRDLKPANILLDLDGTPRITDFGLAKSLTSQSGLTATESVMGSPSYMAPEQAGGRTKQVGPSADIYSLGAIFYELLTGRPPFRGATLLETLEQVKHAEPVPPGRLVPGMPRDAETIALKCLEKDPPKRYSSAEALAADLHRFLAGEPIQARPVQPWVRVAKWARRRPAIAALFVAVHVLLAALLGLGIWSYAEIHRSLNIANEQRDKAERLARNEAAATRGAREQAKIAGERAEELRRRDSISRVDLAFRESRDNNVARALALLDGCPEDLRGWEWEYVRRQCRLELKAIQDPAPSVNAVAFSPDGRLLATGSGDYRSPIGNIPGNVVVRDVETGDEVFARRDLPMGVRAVAFSPDGRFLAAGHAREVVVWELSSGRERFRRSWDGRDGAASLVFSPDGRSLLVGFGLINYPGGEGDARLLNAETGAGIGDVIRGAPDGVWGVAFSPDGQQLALATRGRVQVRDVESRRPVHDFTEHRDFVYGVAFSPDGRLLASCGLDRTIRLYDRLTGTLIRTLTGHEGFVRAVAFSPDSRRLVSGSEDKTVKLWSVDSDRELATFYGHTHFVQSVAFNADGYRVASGGLRGEVKVWFASPSLQLTYPYHDGWVSSVAFTPDGRRVASVGFQGSTDTRTALWDPGTGEADLFLGTSLTENLAFSLDGRRLATGEWSEPMAIWDLETRRISQSQPGLAPAIDVAFSPDGRRLATGHLDDAVRIWDVATGRMLLEFPEVGPRIAGLAFSPDGRLVSATPWRAHSEGDTSPPAVVRIWDVESGVEVHRLEGHTYGISGVAFFPDGKRLISVGGRALGRASEVKVWDLTTGRLIRDLPGHTDVVSAVAMSPDGRRIATGSDDRSIKLWDTTTYDEVFTLRGHKSAIVALAFSPDGRRLVSGSMDRTARVWDLDPPTLDTLYRRAAVAVARPLFDQLLDPEQVAETIRTDMSLSEPIRAAALDVAGRMRVDAPSLARRAQDRTDRGDRQGAAADFERALELSPDDPRILARLAEFHASSGAWARAAETWARAVAQAPQQVAIRYSHVVALLESGDQEGYRRAVADILMQFGATTQADLANSAAWCCLLGPIPKAASSELVRLAERDLAGIPESQEGLVLNTLGAALYRDGRLEEAIRRLEQSVQVSGGIGVAQDWAFLAMAHHRLGRPEEARRWLDKIPADRAVAGIPARPGDDVEIGILFREAKALLADDPPDSP